MFYVDVGALHWAPFISGSLGAACGTETFTTYNDQILLGSVSYTGFPCHLPLPFPPLSLLCNCASSCRWMVSEAPLPWAQLSIIMGQLLPSWASSLPCTHVPFCLWQHRWSQEEQTRVSWSWHETAPTKGGTGTQHFLVTQWAVTECLYRTSTKVTNMKEFHLSTCRSYH